MDCCDEEYEQMGLVDEFALPYWLLSVCTRMLNSLGKQPTTRWVVFAVARGVDADLQQLLLYNYSLPELLILQWCTSGSVLCCKQEDSLASHSKAHQGLKAVATLPKLTSDIWLPTESSERCVGICANWASTRELS